MVVALSLTAGLVYYFSNPKPNFFYDYTFRVAENLMRGHVGFTQPQPSWLNEFVPFEGFYYSVFPLGAVVSMVPFALLKIIGMISEMPGALIAALCAALCCLFMLLIGRNYDVGRERVLLTAAGILFGTWMWANLTFAGAWQLALGFAMVGEFGAIYFTVFDRRPLVAGAFFALGFGNRTEILLTAPIFLWLLHRSEPPALAGGVAPDAKSTLVVDTLPPANAGGSDSWLAPAVLLRSVRFCVVPFILGVATLVYNYVRFHSFTDFGYARIPGVLNEPWYDHGIFSVYYIPRQMWEMLIKPWEVKEVFPYLVPNGFSSSIIWSSPFLLFTFRFGARDRILKYASWIAVGVLCVLLWMHGNSGGWQFGYRYAMVCLPWLFVILLESAPKKITPLEWAAYIFSFAVNLYATWLFNWTEYVKP